MDNYMLLTEMSAYSNAVQQYGRNVADFWAHKWQLRILEDSTNEARKVLVASCAMEASILRHLAVMLTTIRANNVLLLTNTPTTLYDGLLAFVIRGEIRCE